jgi:hypothetical protein
VEDASRLVTSESVLLCIFVVVDVDVVVLFVLMILMNESELM